MLIAGHTFDEIERRHLGRSTTNSRCPAFQAERESVDRFALFVHQCVFGEVFRASNFASTDCCAFSYAGNHARFNRHLRSSRRSSALMRCRRDAHQIVFERQEEVKSQGRLTARVRALLSMRRLRGAGAENVQAAESTTLIVSALHWLAN